MHTSLCLHLLAFLTFQKDYWQCVMLLRVHGFTWNCTTNIYKKKKIILCSIIFLHCILHTLREKYEKKCLLHLSQNVFSKTPVRFACLSDVLWGLEPPPDRWPSFMCVTAPPIEYLENLPFALLFLLLMPALETQRCWWINQSMAICCWLKQLTVFIYFYHLRMSRPSGFT